MCALCVQHTCMLCARLPYLRIYACGYAYVHVFTHSVFCPCLSPPLPRPPFSTLLLPSSTLQDYHFLYWSTSLGDTWQSSVKVKGLGECSIAFLVDPTDGRIIMNCRTGKHTRAQLVWTADGIPGPVTCVT